MLQLTAPAHIYGMETPAADPVAAAFARLRARLADTMTCSWCPEPATGTSADVLLDPGSGTPAGLHHSCGRPGHGRDFTPAPGLLDLPALVSDVTALLRATDPATYTTGPTDANGRVAATNRLACSYCGGTVAPELEYTGHAYSEHRDWVATECDDCGATWDKDGTPTGGPWTHSLSYTLSRRAEAAEAAEAAEQGTGV